MDSCCHTQKTHISVDQKLEGRQELFKALIKAPGVLICLGYWKHRVPYICQQPKPAHCETQV